MVKHFLLMDESFIVRWSYLQIDGNHFWNGNQSFQRKVKTSHYSPLKGLVISLRNNQKWQRAEPSWAWAAQNHYSCFWLHALLTASCKAPCFCSYKQWITCSARLGMLETFADSRRFVTMAWKSQPFWVIAPNQGKYERSKGTSRFTSLNKSINFLHGIPIVFAGVWSLDLKIHRKSRTWKMFLICISATSDDVANRKHQLIPRMNKYILSLNGALIVVWELFANGRKRTWKIVCFHCTPITCGDMTNLARELVAYKTCSGDLAGAFIYYSMNSYSSSRAIGHLIYWLVSDTFI